MVKKVILSLFLAFVGTFLFANNQVSATQEGYVDCGTEVGASCLNCQYNYATCEDECPVGMCDCGSNCPYTPPPPPPPPPPNCGNGTCDSDEDCLNCEADCGACDGEDSCFPAGTKVLLEDENQKNIEDVKVGNKVISQSENGKKSVSTVTELDQPVRDHLCQIKFTDGDNLKLTDEHPLFTQDGWKAINPKNTFKEVPDLPVTELKKGDEVVKSDGTKAEVSSFICWSQKVQTYNLILDNGANTYFADGFLVHNKVELLPCVPGCKGAASGNTGTWKCKLMDGGFCRHAYDESDCQGDTVGCGVKPFTSVLCGCSCNATAPTGLSVSKSGTTWLLTWTKGTKGNKQLVYVGDVKAKVEANCPDGFGAGTGCVVKNESVDKDVESYEITNLADGTVYYFRVVTFKSNTCQAASSTLKYLTSCNLSPSFLTLPVGNTGTLTTLVNDLGTGNYILYSLYGPTNPSKLPIFTIEPTQDSVSPYYTTVTAVRQGTSTVTSHVMVNGVPVCNDVSTVTVTPPAPPGPWWQVKDADVQTNGDLRSEVPSGLYFGLPGLGGFPGVAKYGYGGSTSLSTGNVSNKGWLANSSYAPPNNKVQNYAYFRRMVPSDVVPTSISSNSVPGSFFASGGAFKYDYYWYEYDASTTHLDLSITSAINLPDGRKVIILVTGANLYIEGSITYTSGKSILVALADQDINIDPTVENLMGFYLADLNFSTGHAASGDDSPLYLKGSVAVLGELNLQRNLGSDNADTPAEVFEYDPASAFLFPPKLSVEKTRWKEVAP